MATETMRIHDMCLKAAAKTPCGFITCFKNP
jgi:hypothetical protein